MFPGTDINTMCRFLRNARNYKLAHQKKTLMHKLYFTAKFSSLTDLSKINYPKSNPIAQFLNSWSNHMLIKLLKQFKNTKIWFLPILF